MFIAQGPFLDGRTFISVTKCCSQSLVPPKQTRRSSKLPQYHWHGLRHVTRRTQHLRGCPHPPRLQLWVLRHRTPACAPMYDVHTGPDDTVIPRTELSKCLT